MIENPRDAERAPARESWTSLLVPVALILGLALLLSLPAGPGGREMPTGLVAVWVERIVGYLGAAVVIAAALVVGVAVLRSLASYRRELVGRGIPADSIEAIRQRLGRALALGLEFTIASDILRTAVAPTREDIMNLGAIVLLRTLLNHFLERDIRRVAAAQAVA